MEEQKEVIIGLVFTYGMSLAEWVRLGIFDREKQIYEEHLRLGHCDKVIWFTYGIGDTELHEQLIKEHKIDNRILVVDRPASYRGKKGMLKYAMSIPTIQKSFCSILSVIKTEQMSGAWVADKISKKYKIPFLLRTGYTYSLFKKQEISEQNFLFNKLKKYLWYCFYSLMEKRMYNACSYATVASKQDKDYVCARYGINTSKVVVNTNYIDCELFHPSENSENLITDRFLFVGRLSEQKNLRNLFEAFAGINGIGLDLYGDGEQLDELKKLAEDSNNDINFMGRVANRELSNIYRRYKYYILASNYEGMPKTLLEAMACGLICFGTDVVGINEVIEDKVNGYIIPGTSPEAIRNTVISNMDKTNQNDGISRRAVEDMRIYHSLIGVTNLEWDLIQMKK